MIPASSRFDRTEIQWSTSAPACARRCRRSGEANPLVVAKLDRLSRSLIDFTGLMAKAQRQGRRARPHQPTM